MGFGFTGAALGSAKKLTSSGNSGSSGSSRLGGVRFAGLVVTCDCSFDEVSETFACSLVILVASPWEHPLTCSVPTVSKNAMPRAAENVVVRYTVLPQRSNRHRRIVAKTYSQHVSRVTHVTAVKYEFWAGTFYVQRCCMSPVDWVDRNEFVMRIALDVRVDARRVNPSAK